MPTNTTLLDQAKRGEIPFAYIQEDDIPVRFGIERILKQNGLDHRMFIIRQFNHLPKWLEDKFSLSFKRGAARRGKGVIVTTAHYVPKS
jgi:hypothetical protein